MRQSKPEETAQEATETHASDRLLRHYRKIGAPAVAAALNVGKRKEEKNAEASGAAAPPAFLDHHAA